MLTCGVQGRRARFAKAARLVAVVGILLVMSRLFFLVSASVRHATRQDKREEQTNLCEILPVLFLLVVLSLPLLADDFGDVRIIQARMEGNDILLMVLPI
jgi:hypothetical protein